MILKIGENKRFETTQKIPLLAYGDEDFFLPAGTIARVARSDKGLILLLDKAPPRIYGMDEKYLAFCKEVKQ